MATISAADVKRLREMTSAGMMECKKALEESDGDFDKAVEALRISGAAKAAKRGADNNGRLRKPLRDRFLVGGVNRQAVFAVRRPLTFPVPPVIVVHDIPTARGQDAGGILPGVTRLTAAM